MIVITAAEAGIKHRFELLWKLCCQLAFIALKAAKHPPN